MICQFQRGEVTLPWNWHDNLLCKCWLSTGIDTVGIMSVSWEAAVSGPHNDRVVLNVPSRLLGNLMLMSESIFKHIFFEINIYVLIWLSLICTLSLNCSNPALVLVGFLGMHHLFLLSNHHHDHDLSNLILLIYKWQTIMFSAHLLRQPLIG